MASCNEPGATQHDKHLADGRPRRFERDATNGAINLSDFSGSMNIGQVVTSQGTGNVTLTADENILAANSSSLVEGGAIALTASFGSVGSLGTGGTANAQQAMHLRSMSTSGPPPSTTST